MQQSTHGGAVRTHGRRSGSAVRRSTYLLNVVIGGALLYLINVRPGWQVLPFLTGETRQVLGVLNVSLVAGMIVNTACLIADLRRVKALADVVTLGIGLAVVVRVWQVFPFDFGTSGFDWGPVVRVVLALAILGSVIGIIAQFATLIRRPVGDEDRTQ
jgi:hypothetical protein